MIDRDVLHLTNILDCIERICDYTAAGKQAFLTHQYLRVELAEVWKAVECDLPELAPKISNLLSN